MLSQHILSGVVGIMLFFSVAIAPTIFKVLPQEWASRYVRQFFPRYYAVLGVACVVAGGLASAPSPRLIALACAAFFFISLWALTPAINRAADTSNRRRFTLLHLLSVGINMMQLLALVAAVWLA